MKTQMIRLEVYDDYISARDKMGWNKAGRILLIWPESGRVLHRRLDLVLLQRHSRSLGAQLVLVSRDAEVRANARRLAIPIFANLSQAQQAHWRADRRLRVQKQPELAREPRPRPDLQSIRQALKPPTMGWLDKPWARAIIFSFGLLAILALAGFLAPSAILELTPQSEVQSLEFEIQARPDLRSLTLSGALPAEPMRVLVEGSAETQTSGVQRVPDSFAVGEVQFTNLSTQTLTIPAGLILRSLDTPPQRYVTTRAGEIEAGPGSTFAAPVRALAAGAQGNQTAGRVRAIEGALGTVLAVNNPRAIQGGADRSLPAPSEQDRIRLIQQLESELRLVALGDLQDNLAPGDLLLPASITVTQVIEQTFEPLSQQPANTLHLHLLLEYQAYYIKGSSLTNLAAAVLDANLPAGYTAVANSLEIEVLQPPVLGEANQPGAIRARRRMQSRLSPEAATRLVLGMPPQLAVERLGAELALANAPIVRLSPSWWPRLPILPLRIGVIIHESPGR